MLRCRYDASLAQSIVDEAAAGAADAPSQPVLKKLRANADASLGTRLGEEGARAAADASIQ